MSFATPPQCSSPFSWYEVRKREEEGKKRPTNWLENFIIHLTPIGAVLARYRQVDDPCGNIWLYWLWRGCAYGLWQTSWRTITRDEYEESFGLRKPPQPWPTPEEPGWDPNL